MERVAGFDAGILAVSGRQHHQSMKVLETPAALDQFDGQPIEQLRMRGGIAHCAEVAGRGDDAGAEMMLPQAIDEDTGCQRIVLARQPTSQSRTPSRRFPLRNGANVRRGFIEKMRKTRLKFLPRLAPVAAG